MIFLRSRNLLFVKPKKTAGTSVEIALSCNASDEDIVTPLLAEDEKKRWEIGGAFPVNWAWFRFLETQYRKKFERYLETGIVPDRFFGLRPGRLYSRMGAKFINHITPDQIRKRAGSDFLEQSYMVTIVRHPYDVIISMSHHLATFHNRPLENVIEETVSQQPFNDAYLFGSKTPDFVIRYESLREDLAELEGRFGLELLEKLPFTKHKARKDRRPAKEALTPDQRARVQRNYSRVFDTFGYDT